MSSVAVVTGAGSGVGRATSVALAKAGWSVALVGRREETLRETAQLCGTAQVKIIPCDIAIREAVRAMAQQAVRELGQVEALVNAAGTNTPKRALKVVSIEDYHALVDTNLNGAYYCIEAFLPAMRERKSGTIINIVSDSARQASAKAGVAYVISKFGLLGLTQSINAEERANGIRACAILPGEIDTPLLERRPAPPTREARGRMLQAEDVAECALLAIRLPSRAIIEEMLICPP